MRIGWGRKVDSRAKFPYNSKIDFFIKKITFLNKMDEEGGLNDWLWTHT